MRRARSLALAVGLFGSACGSTAEAPPAPPTPDPSAIPDPAPAQALGGLAALPPAQFDRREAMLGRALFHDTRLSGDGTVACVSCHQLDHGGAEPRATSLGIHNQTGPINAPPVLNSMLNFVQFWDGRADTLEAQCAGPVTNPLEMGASWDAVIPVIAADPWYAAEIAAVHDGAPCTQDVITGAIAEYERMLITPGRFDRFVGGDASALTEDERRGYALFTSVGCTSCHTGANVGGTMYQKMGLVNDWFGTLSRPLTDADMGRYNVTHDEADRHRFKVPSLRNIALTAPYFHDGSQTDLAEVVRIMGHHQLGRELTAEQIRLIVAFLGSLTGEVPADAYPQPIPAAVPTPPEGEVPAPTPAAPTGPAAPPEAASS